jgi:hypothetical protein
MAKQTVAVMCRDLTQGRLTAFLLVKTMAARAAAGDRFATEFMVLASNRQFGALAAMASLLSNAGAGPSSRDFRYAMPRDVLLLSLRICCALLVMILTAAGATWLFDLHAADAAPAVAAGAVAAPPRGTTSWQWHSCQYDRRASSKPPAATRKVRSLREKSSGSDQPDAAVRLDNLAQLLQATNRLAKAEPLMRRALATGEKSSRPDQPEIATDPGNLAGLLRALAILKLERRASHEALSGDNWGPPREMDESGGWIEATPEGVPGLGWPRP